ncbi:MAG: HD family phosphohydrolase [Thermaurantimonas sp.]
MSLWLHFLIKIKNTLIKNREAILFFVASIGFVLFYPDERRFPFEWKLQSEWKHTDIHADFSFVRPLSDAELSSKGDSLNTYFVYFRLHTSNPKIDYVLTDTSANKEQIESLLRSFLKKYESGLISDDKPVEFPGLKKTCFLIENNDTFLINCSQVIDVRNLRKQIIKSIDSLYLYWGFTQSNADFQIRPNLQFVKQVKLKPDDNFFIQKSEVIERGTPIVQRGQFIDRVTHERLLYYKNLYVTGYPYGLKKFFILTGKWMLVLLILTMLYQFLVYFRPNVFEDSSKLLMILTIVFLFFAIVMKTAQFQEDWIYFIPLPIVPIVLKAFYDTRLALFCHFLLLLLISPGISSFYSFFILHFASGVFSIITVESIYKRSQLFTSVFKIIAVYFIVYLSLELTSGVPFSEPATYVKLSANAFLILLAFPIIYSIEKIFGMVSDLSLLELSDTNMPLLKELAEKAPGTFQHSIQVSSLAESAAAKVGANTLLVRTAALYHDIGKMSHPQFFVENQITGYNPHDELSFEESARVIIEHVKEGVKIARQRKLPESIIDFIRTHHGTTTVQYFYNMYLKNFPENTDSEHRFRYDGPTPFSKETAILMLADSVEAACRSLAQRGADRFQMEAQIEAIFTSLMDQRQFDNANISLSEISEIKKTLKKKILNIYHSRIPYPK